MYYFVSIVFFFIYYSYCNSVSIFTVSNIEYKPNKAWTRKINCNRFAHRNQREPQNSKRTLSLHFILQFDIPYTTMIGSRYTTVATDVINDQTINIYNKLMYTYTIIIIMKTLGFRLDWIYTVNEIIIVIFETESIILFNFHCVRYEILYISIFNVHLWSTE